MNDQWYFRSGATEGGPCPFEELCRQAQDGRLRPGDEVRRGEAGEWVPAESIEGLLPELQELHDLSELDFTFVNEASSPAGTVPSSNSPSADEPEEIADLSELQIDFVSGATSPPTRTTGQRAPGGGEMPPTVADSDSDTRSDEEWFCQSLGQQLGPMPLEELLLLAQSGSVESRDPVRRGTTGDWQAAEEFPELATVWNVPSPSSNAAGPEKQQADKQQTQAPSALQVASSAQGAPSAEAAPSHPGKKRRRKKAGTKSRENAGHQPAASERAAPQPPPSAEPEESSESSTSSAEETAAPAPVLQTADRWFCRIDGIEHGPLTRSDLQAMARHGRLKKSDQIREGDEGNWQRAESDAELFPQETAASPGVSASSVTPVAAAPVSRPKKTGPSIFARLFAAKPKKPRGPREPWLAKLAEQKLSLLLVGGLLIAVVVILLAGLGFFSTSAESYYEELNSLWKEHQALRQRKANAAAWAPLMQRGEELKTRLVEDLDKGKRASARTPHLQELLWAGRDWLLPMLKKCRKEAGKEEREFARHLKMARWLIDHPGTPPPESFFEKEAEEKENSKTAGQSR